MRILNCLMQVIERKRLYLLYLCYALPAGLFLIIATPPFQTPDAVNHFYRAIQISDGHLLGERLGLSSGGPIDSGSIAFSHFFDPLVGHSNVKVTEAMLAPANSIGWTHDEQIAEFPNTAIYPAYAYLPQVIGIEIGRLFRMTVRNTLMLACAVGLLLSVALTSWAIAISRKMAPLIFATALLPSTLMIFSSVSQEVSFFPVCFLLIAYLDRCLNEGEVLGASWLIVASLGLILCISSRPPYVGLLILLLCPGLRIGADAVGYGWGKRLLWCAVVAGVSIAVTSLFGNAAWAPVPLPRSVAGQLAYLIHAPLNIVSIANATLRQNWTLYYQSFIGVLGWLEVYMSPKYYKMAVFVLLLAIVATMLRSRLVERARAADRLIVTASIVTCIGMIFGSLYLTWTPVGQQVVDGVQGRYFLAFFPLLGLALPQIAARGQSGVRALHAIERASVAIVAIFPVYTCIEVVRAIIVRFYLQ